MFEMYSPEGKKCNAVKEQIEILKNAGYTFEKPVVKQEEKKAPEKVQVK